jgi:hypothetical protein
MAPGTHGIHHVTAIAGDAQALSLRQPAVCATSSTHGVGRGAGAETAGQ